MYPPIPAAAEAGPPRKTAEEEDPRLRWAFVRKVYCNLTLQCALTAGASAVACFVRPVPRFFVSGPPAARWPILIAVIISPLIVMWPMYRYRAKHRVNLLLLGLFTLCCSLMMAVATSTTLDRAIVCDVIHPMSSPFCILVKWFFKLQSSQQLLSSASPSSHSGQPCKGFDFTFRLPFLSTILNALLVYLLIQIYLPLGTVGTTIFGYIATLMFSGFIICDTSLLLKRYTYDEYVVTAISLYLDIISLFMAQISLSSLWLPVSLHSLTRLTRPVHGGSH